MTIYEARTAAYEMTELSKAEGRISGSFIYAYPPDVPILIPGEIITEGIIRTVISAEASGADIKGLENGMVRGLL